MPPATKRMKQNSLLGGAILLWFWIGGGAAALQAQSRVGPSDAAIASTAAATGTNAAAHKTVGPNLLPVQHYAVIDLGEAGEDDVNNQWAVALDDEGNAAFGNLSNAIDGTATVQTFSKGAWGTPATYPKVIHIQETDEGGVDWVFNFDRLLPSGTVVAHRATVEWSYAGSLLHSTGCGCFLSYVNGSNEMAVLGRPLPYLDAYPYFSGNIGDEVHIDYSSPRAQNYALYFTYGSISMPGGGEFAQDRYAHVMRNNGVSYYFAADTPAFLADTAKEKYIRQDVSVEQITDAGWAMVSYNGSLQIGIWDGNRIVTAGLPAPGGGIDVYGLNNQGWCLVGNRYYHGEGIPEGAIWHGKTVTNFTAFLKDGPWEHQLKQVQPLRLSNQNATDHRMYALTILTDDGREEQVVWVGTPPAQPSVPESSSSYKWQPYRMEFPEGMMIAPTDLRSVNSSGLIAAIGDPDGDTGPTATKHALLLIPMGLRLFNGKTANFDGSIVTRIVPKPENPHYDDDVADQNNEDFLGAKTLGRGKTGYPNSYIYDLMVAAEAPNFSWLHYKWERKLTRSTWNIRKSPDNTNWNVTVRDRLIYEDDLSNDPLGTNHVPSEQLHRFYSYDNTGMTYDPGTADPTADGFSQIGDCVYCEKKFTRFYLALEDQIGMTTLPNGRKELECTYFNKFLHKKELNRR